MGKPFVYSKDPRAVAARVRAEFNRELRVWVTTEDGGGYWYAKYAPPEVHGRSSGCSYWHCHCPPCRTYARASQEKARKTRKRNREILATLQARHVTMKEEPVQASEAPAVPTGRDADLESRSEQALEEAPVAEEAPSGSPGHSPWSDYKESVLRRLRGH